MSDPAADPSRDTPAGAGGMAERLLARGEPLLAYNTAQSGLERWPGDVRLRQLQALALARSGDVPRANDLLSALAREGRADTETLGMLARTHKDLALAAADEAGRERHLAAGYGLYRRAFESALAGAGDDGAFYAGINAAALAVLRGDLAEGRRLAALVRDICRRGGEGGEGASRYWREATLGEAALVLGETQAAAAHYDRAAALAGGRHGDVSSTRRQARLLAACLPGRPEGVADALRVPPVLVFTGNMIDAPGRAVPRFPAAREGAVREALEARIEAIRPAAAYGSAASGADLLCLEAVRERGGETHIVLPFPPAQFREASVDPAGAGWAERFERALAAADSVTVASDHRASGSSATFEYANLLLTGQGQLRAQVLDTNLVALSVRDPEAPGAPGGAASLEALWRSRGLATERVAIGVAAETPAASATAPGPASLARPALRHELRSLLFADAVGYSQMSEDQIPAYVAGFLGAVAALNRRTRHRFEHVETAGDGLYAVFASAEDAGRYALELSALVRNLDRGACGLPAGFDLRIAVHCGPVHCGSDPITGRNLYTGPHTSRAARIEPITPPGQVYASSAFAAVAAATGATGLAMRYVGRIPLAKGYGTQGLYCVQPAA